MVRIGTCIPCQYGNHERCQKVMQAVPKGMLGGAICGCKGECQENREARRALYLRRISGRAVTPPLTEEACS
jgi:hypothetical protein